MSPDSPMSIGAAAVHTLVTGFYRSQVVSKADVPPQARSSSVASRTKGKAPRNSPTRWLINHHQLEIAGVFACEFGDGTTHILA